MFIAKTGSDYRGTELIAWGEFLIVFQPPYESGAPSPPPLRAAVRYVHMRQLGHFMMAVAQVGRHRVSLSGPYGGDGLPREAPADLWPLLLDLPPELQAAFWKGGGHNSAGSEAGAMRDWAIANLAALKLSGRTQTHGSKRKPR